jgi:hypothetical protein
MAATLRLLRLLPLLIVLPSCSALAPSEAAPAVVVADENAAPTVGVCYSRLAATPAQIADTAAQECVPGTTPRLMSQEYNLSRCPVLTPIRATFTCVAR